MKKNNGIIIVCLLTITCCLAVRGASFAIDGNLVGDYPAINYKINVPFHMVVDSNKWQIQVQFAHYKELCWSDGINVSCFSLFPRQKGDTALSQAKVLHGPYPFFSDPSIKLIWLAFASSEYFTVNTNTMPALWKKDNLDPTAECIEIRNIEFLGNQLKIPSKLDFIFSVTNLSSLTNFHYLSKTVSTLELEKDYSELKAYDNSFCGHFEVASTTNLNGLIMPLKFNLEVYNGKTNRPPEKFSGEVNTIASAASEPAMPDLPYPLWVDDYRFSDEKSKTDDIGYVVTNAAWPSINDETLQRLFVEKTNSRTAYSKFKRN